MDAAPENNAFVVEEIRAFMVRLAQREQDIVTIQVTSFQGIGGLAGIRIIRLLRAAKALCTDRPEAFAMARVSSCAECAEERIPIPAAQVGKDNYCPRCNALLPPFNAKSALQYIPNEIEAPPLREPGPDGVEEGRGPWRASLSGLVLGLGFGLGWGMCLAG